MDQSLIFKNVFEAMFSDEEQAILQQRTRLTGRCSQEEKQAILRTK